MNVFTYTGNIRKKPFFILILIVWGGWGGWGGLGGLSGQGPNSYMSPGDEVKPDQPRLVKKVNVKPCSGHIL